MEFVCMKRFKVAKPSINRIAYVITECGNVKLEYGVELIAVRSDNSEVEVAQSLLKALRRNIACALMQHDASKGVAIISA